MKPELFRWACRRSGQDQEALVKKFPALPDWISEKKFPTFKQLEKFAKATHTPFGYFFLSEPPVETMPIEDLRDHRRPPSPNLLDTIYLCQQRQEWYRQNISLSKLDFVGSANKHDPVSEVAANIRNRVFDLEIRRGLKTLPDAMAAMVEAAGQSGILVMISDSAGCDRARKLNIFECSGFALSDTLAPLVFVNGAGTVSEQMFAMANGISYLWLGKTGIWNNTAASKPDAVFNADSYYCNSVAAEMLVPLHDFSQVYNRLENVSTEIRRLSGRYMVGADVIIRRMLDMGDLSRNAIAQLRDFNVEADDLRIEHASHVSSRFSHAIIVAAEEGRTTLTEASRLLCRRYSDVLESLKIHT